MLSSNLERKVAFVLFTSFLVLLAGMAMPSYADRINPNDDVTLRGTTNYNATSPFGLFVKNSTDVSYMEYTLGSSAATEAKLVLHNDDASVTSLWTIVVKGAEYSFNEATFTGTDTSSWTQVGTIPNVMAVAFYQMDLTTWYNNNLGKTMTLFMTRSTQPAGSGPIFEDKEGTKTGNAATYGPRLEVTLGTPPPGAASNPSPGNGATSVSTTTDLSWTAGAGATSHNVYFGTTSPGTSRGNQTATTYDTGTMPNNTTHYWRIDEVNAGGTTTGTVWSFTTVVAPSYKATNPSPINAAGSVSVDADLSWTAGVSAVSHDVYFGTSQTAVTNASRLAGDVNGSGSVDINDLAVLAQQWLGAPASCADLNGDDDVDIADFAVVSADWLDSADSVYKGNQAGTNFDPGTLANSTTYYWRVDEVNCGEPASPWTGDIWSFTTIADEEETTAVAYWRLDETSGSTAYDSVGSVNGTLVNMDNSDWVSGMVNGALDFDGVNDYVTIARSSVLEIGHAVTHKLSASAWIKHDLTSPPTIYTAIVGTGDGGWYLGSFPNENKLYFACWLLNGGSGQTAVVTDGTPVFDGQWHHVVVVYDGSSVHMYVDGNHAEASTIGGTIRNIYDKSVFLAENAYATGRYWDGRIDDVKIYDYALSSEEVYHMLNPSHAWNPSPVSGAGGVTLDAGLSWSAGTGAVSHDVYFGTDSTLDAGEFQGNQSPTVFDPGTLTEGNTYYWRIDEVSSGGTVTGRVWNFTTGTMSNQHGIVWPGTSWQTKTPAELGLDSAKLDQLATNIGGQGIIVRQGYVVKTWGDQAAKADWASAAKPVTTTLLFYAIEEGLLDSVNELIEDHGWDLITKDEPMEFYHLANMTSGYARGEAPGAAWAYNDYAITLYVKTLFDNVYGTTPNTAATNANRLGALGFQDGTLYSSRNGYGVETSVRDFARIGWLWCNKGYWNGQQLLPRWYFDEYMKAQVSGSLPRTTTSGTDYLGIGTYGGGSDQSADGPGVYGFNWWCNSDVVNWPDAPADTVQANGHWGAEVVTVIPSLSLVVAYKGGDTRTHTTGSSSSEMNQDLKLLTEGCPPFSVGTIIVDPTNPARMVYSNTYENGHLKPVCFAGPGDPEDFFYNDTTNNLNLLTGRGARCTYITAVLQDFGGGNPGTGTALDTKLTEWEGYITQLENAGVITVFFFFDDSQGLTSNWEELVDKCVAKFKHHKLLIWSVAEEYGEALSTAQVSAVAARIKSQDENSHVVGVHQNHGNTFNFLGDSNLDMFLMQLNYTTPGDLHTAVKNSNANGTKILNMAEATDHAKQTRTNVRLWNWASIMGGASAVQVLWMGRASDPADWNTVDKYNDCARLMDFMESVRLNETSNRDDLARGNTDYVLANPGQVYIAYGDSGTSLGVNVLAGTYRKKWYDPVDGDWVDQGSTVLTAGDQTFTKPVAISAEAALYLELEAGEILPNDDCATRDGVNYDNYPTEFGLMVKNAGDVSWIEFNFGGAPVSQAVLTLFQADGGVTNDWDIVVRGAEYNFDETTFTGTDVSAWTVAGTIPDVRLDNQYHNLDITSFYNSNLGKTMTLQLGRDVQPAGNGPIFGDKEGTRPDASVSQGPKISIN